MPAEDVLEEAKSFHKKDGSYKKSDFARVSQIGLKPSAICVSARAQGTGKVVWSRDLGFKENLEFSRDRLMENFLWVMGIGFEPHLSKCRIGAIDDDYDIYGSLDELESFTHAVKRWDVKAIKGRPFYMKICYLAMLNFGNDLIYAVLKTHGLDVSPFIKEEHESKRGDVAKAVQCYMVEKGISEEEAIHDTKELISHSWKMMNKEIISKNNSVPNSMVRICLSMTRTAQCICQDGDGIGTSIGVTRDRLASLIVKPVPMDLYPDQLCWWG
ncbi:hypothetical protein TIFTF001_038977 [Ficus carica]|uniref:Terpene synthase metal-binding domain-containing protein n=1 Tax=Ficus carica TaxID=3494 RepID=A0AA88JEK9_FICCA|nr:hypothetical protein TIFTF001_038977 [Ficus carica]